MTYSVVHSHAEMSPDGVGKIQQWVSKAKEKGLYGWGLTDHGSMGSALELYDEGKKQNFPVALGEEFYVKNDEDEKSYYHLTLWCKNAIGYKNLCTLSSMAFNKEYFYSKPRITNELLFKYKKGLVVGSGCFIGELGQHLLYQDGKATTYLLKMKEEFGDDFYIELMPALVKMEERFRKKPGLELVEDGTNLQIIQNRMLLDIAIKSNTKFICSSDAHMPDASLETVQRVKMHNKSKKWEYDYIYYMHTPEEFKKQWTEEFGLSEEDFEIGCQNSNEIIDKCKDLELKFEWKLPKINYDLYPVKCDLDSKSLTVALIKHHNKIPKDQIHMDRLGKEIDLIADNGVHDFLPYFLFLEEVVRYCKKERIMVGNSRGSVGGSLLAYALDITELDPIKYNLPFERFLNAARIKKGTLPDIDLDIESRRRPEVLKHICDTYGMEHVASFGTVHTMKVKSALKDAIRILDTALSQDDIDGLCASIPYSESDSMETIEDIKIIIDKSPILKNYLSKHPDIEHTMLNSIGQMRQYGVHAAAIAVSPTPIREFVPLARKAKDEIYYTQYPMEYCGKAGLIKYDILGLNTLSDISTCLDLIKTNHGLDIHPWRDIPLDDAGVMAKFQSRQTVTVFQFNTEAFSDLLKRAKVETLDDLVAINTLGRPGTLDSGMDKEWIKRRIGVPFEYDHPCLEPILKDTYGIILYQEQVMKALQVLADFSLEEADDIRSAIGKKKTDVIEEYKVVYLDRIKITHPDITKKKAEEMWDKIEAFGRYSFGMAHAVSYTVIAYVCMWLKTHYPLEWWCSILRNEQEDDMRRYYYKTIKGIIAPYSVNNCGTDYFIQGKMIVPPITSIKFIGKAIANQLIKGAPFKDFDDFYTRVDKVALKKHVVINMILGGMFADIEPARSEEQLIEHFYKTYLDARLKADGKPNASWREWEAEFMSISPSELKKKRMEILPHNSISLNDLYMGEDSESVMKYSDIRKAGNEEKIKMVGLVLNVHHTKTKKGDNMFFAEVSNEGESMSLTVFPRQAIKLRDIFRKGKILKIDGSMNRYNGKTGILVDNAIEIDQINKGVEQ